MKKGEEGVGKIKERIEMKIENIQLISIEKKLERYNKKLILKFRFASRAFTSGEVEELKEEVLKYDR